MKIILVQHSNFINGSGGTEKICSFLANGFASVGHQVEIATNENITGKPMFPLNKEVVVTNIFNTETRQIVTQPVFNYHGENFFKWLKFKIQKKRIKFHNKKITAKAGGEAELYKFNLRQRSKDWKKHFDTAKPDVVITMSIGSLLEISYGNTYDFPIVNSTNGRPDYDFKDDLWYRSPVEMQLLKESYEKLAAIQVLFGSYKDYLPETFHGKSVVIPNPVPQFQPKEMAIYSDNKQRFSVVNIASLVTDCKQQHIAIDIFARLHRHFPKWDLYFWGVGSDQDYLHGEIKKHHLEDRVFLKGFTDKPLEILKSADIFIFPSKYEGFPLALTEAMSIGLPCLGFETCSGVNELIRNNENGFLAKDKDEMEIQLIQLMENSYLREKLGKKAHDDMKQFDENYILKQWLHFIWSIKTL